MIRHPSRRLLLRLFAGAAAVGAAPAHAFLRSETLYASGDYAVRRTAALVTASVVATGSRRQAMGIAFPILADYVSRDNARNLRIDMQSPRRGQPSQQWAIRGRQVFMDAPVLQSPAGADAAAGIDAKIWRVSFIMPPEYVLETMPRPRDPAVILARVPFRTRAVVRLSAVPNAAVLRRNTAALLGYIAHAGLKPTSPPRYAFYEPPFTLAYPRRSEISFAVKD